MYNDELELSHVSLYLNYQDLINNSPEAARHIRPESITFDSTTGDISVDSVLVSSSKPKIPTDRDGWNRSSAFEERIKEQGLIVEEDHVDCGCHCCVVWSCAVSNICLNIFWSCKSIRLDE